MKQRRAYEKTLGKAHPREGRSGSARPQACAQAGAARRAPANAGAQGAPDKAAPSGVPRCDGNESKLMTTAPNNPASDNGICLWPVNPVQRVSYVLFDVIYDDGSQRSNRRVPADILGGIDGDEPARVAIEAQDQEIAARSRQPMPTIKSVRRSS